MLGARVAGMPPRSRQMVEAMACLGGRAELSLLQAATGEPADVVEQLLAPALEEGLLVVDSGAREALRFRHDRIREVVLDGLHRQERRARQLAIARRLAELPELFAVAAEQYLPVVDEVDDPAERRRVVALLRQAADQARLIGDYALVNALLTAALRLVDPAETAAVLELRTGRHAALFSLGRLEEADEEYRTSRSCAATALDRVDATAVQVRSLSHRTRFAEADRARPGIAARLRHRPCRPPVGSQPGSTTSSTASTGGWTAPARPRIWLAPSSATPGCWPRAA